tara:strand:+ start:649 stop:2034 length:1386 start_codon:yes stop_codon:yes gene_type:complete
MNIGVLALGRSTFDVEFAKEKLNQCTRFLYSTKYNILGNCELLLDESDVSKEIEKLQKERVDFILILQVTFTDAISSIKISASFKKPIGIWAFPEPRLGGRLRLNAFCGLNLASHAMSLNDFEFSWLYEDPETVDFSKFNKIFEKKRKYSDFLNRKIPNAGSKKAKEIKDKIFSYKIGKIGNHPDGFDTCNYDPEKLRTFCGIKVDEINLYDLFSIAKTVKRKKIEETFEIVEKEIPSIKDVDQEELLSSLKLKTSLQQIKKVGKYDAFAIRCWPEMFTEYGGAICAPASMMTENKTPCACEADVYGAVTQLILQAVSNQPVFLTDIVDMDIEDNTGVFWHCGQAPISMCDPEFKPRATIHTNRKMPLLFEFPLKEGEVTIMRVSQAFGKHKMILCKGTVLKRGLPFAGTSGVIKFEKEASQVLENIISSGLEHHVAIAYGDHIKLLSEVASELRLPILYI